MLDLKKVNEILDSEMVFATGCTEPGAIAFTVSAAKDYLEGVIIKIVIKASGNVIKNAMAAGIPGTSYIGIKYAAAIGAVGGKTELRLDVISDITDKQYEIAERLVTENIIDIEVIDSDEKLYIEAQVSDDLGNIARAIVTVEHTNLVLIELNGETVLENYAEIENTESIARAIINEWSVRRVFDFVKGMEVGKDTPEIIRLAMKTNRLISDEGIRGRYGMNIGKNILEGIKNKLFSEDIVTHAMIKATSGIDARMAGAPIGVVTNSGSGNQGIMATMAVVGVADFLRSDEDSTIKAVTLSNMITIYIHAKFGRLSALCGATCAAIGVACGIVYLLGGGGEEIDHAIKNVIADITGMLCDGAKPNCAVKVATCVSSAGRAAILAMNSVRSTREQGIIEESVERTIQNFCSLGSENTREIDKAILQMMTNKASYMDENERQIVI